MSTESDTLMQELDALANAESDPVAIQHHFFKRTHGGGGVPPMDLTGVVFDERNMDHFDFSGLDLTDAMFRSCSLVGAKFNNSTLSRASFGRVARTVTDCTRADFTGAKASGVNFSCKLLGATFRNTRLHRVRFTHSDLRGAHFEGCTLLDADFSYATMTTATTFHDISSTSGMRIRRYGLACLGPNFGGLTEGNRMDMEIIDDAATLRATFGGFWAVLHTGALLIFLLPYLRFLVTQSLAAKFHLDSENSVTLLRAIGRFIASGGQSWGDDWKINWLSLTAFVVFLAYNCVRLVLLWKTKVLETQQYVSGLPVEFSFVNHADNRWLGKYRWYICFRFVKVMLFVAVVSVAVNTWHFLQQRIPPGP
jgi:uncharacterized protein YjbI with pentapeptide repeats